MGASKREPHLCCSRRTTSKPDNQKGIGITMSTYQKIIRDLREDHDMTQEQVAQYLGTSQTMYARYERGASEMPIRHLISLSKLYGVSTDFILGLSKKKK